MSDPVAVAIIGAIPAVLTALALFQNRKLSHQMNSMQDKLVQKTADASHAAGKVEGIAQQKAETDVRMKS